MCTPFLTQACLAQEVPADITDSLYATYENYRENTLKKRRIKHSDLQPLITEFSKNADFSVNKVGSSIEGRPLFLISTGSGDIDVFLWSQMHGDEPTATQAIFDILNFLNSEDFSEEKKDILSRLRLHFLPMLNPDGAEIYQRRNTLGIDINRDALRLQSPEGRTLKRVRDSLDADFGFNLHDQSTYYNAERTAKPATISYLAPAYNYEKEINEVRGNAMKIIVFMNDIIQRYAPGQVGRYNDDFEPRAFGDNIQKWGTSTILIESGGYPEDVEKQYIRKLNYVSILAAIYAIATKAYADIPLSAYGMIPENDRKLFDLKLTKLTYNLLGEDYLLDLGIHRLEVDKSGHGDFWYKSSVADQGDLSTFYAYDTLNAEGYRVIGAKAYPETLPGLEEAEKLDTRELLRSGYAYLRLLALPKDLESSPLPLHLVRPNYKVPALYLNIGINPTFFLQKDGAIHYAVINGFLIDLQEGVGEFRNALIYR
jgi:hypothetical protein